MGIKTDAGRSISHVCNRPVAEARAMAHRPDICVYDLLLQASMCIRSVREILDCQNILKL